MWGLKETGEGLEIETVLQTILRSLGGTLWPGGSWRVREGMRPDLPLRKRIQDVGLEMGWGRVSDKIQDTQFNVNLRKAMYNFFVSILHGAYF